MKRILVVEDEEKIRRAYGRVLREEGFEVIERSNAADAYRALRRGKVDLVVLDIRMPRVEGNLLYEILTYYRIGGSVLVASVYPVETQKRLVPGAAGYHDKSDGIEMLLEKIKRILAAAHPPQGSNPHRSEPQ
jgi:DNA-binding NtrC family response regulator